MKVIFCGPPHSGKSVFIANIVNQMPAGSYTVIRGCPDGEGSWSNNINQNQIRILREKGKFTETFIRTTCEIIGKQTNSITLVDVGGKISDENKEIFKCCDSFIVISSSEEEKQKWLEFGKENGLECIGCLDSRLDGQEEIYSTTPYIQGRITNLNRGETLQNSEVIKAIVSAITEKSLYKEKLEKIEKTEKAFNGTVLNGIEIASRLGYLNNESGKDGNTPNIKWEESAISELYQLILNDNNIQQPVRINEFRANFALCAVCKALKQKGIKDISIKNISTNSYVQIVDLPKKKNLRQAPGLVYNIIENKDNVYIHIDITKERYTFEDFEKCILPSIDEGKNLYISGRLPLWLLASITNSYSAKRIYTFQPGKTFTCISSENERDLGRNSKGIDLIFFNEYIEQLKEKNKKEDLPVVVKKEKGIISIIKRFLEKIRGKHKKEDHVNLDMNIVQSKSRSNIELKGDASRIEEGRFKEELRRKSNLSNGIGINVESDNNEQQENNNDDMEK